MVLATLKLEAGGRMTLECNGKGGSYSYVSAGTWSFSFDPNGMDQVTLLFTSTDHPQHAGSPYNVECVYAAHTESWEDGDSRFTALILEPMRCSGVSPFEELTGFDGAALYREQGPNMKIVNCQDFVSLREKPAKNAARLAKVPLGASVLAFPKEEAKTASSSACIRISTDISCPNTCRGSGNGRKQSKQKSGWKPSAFFVWFSSDYFSSVL